MVMGVKDLVADGLWAECPQDRDGLRHTERQIKACHRGTGRCPRPWAFSGVDGPVSVWPSQWLAGERVTRGFEDGLRRPVSQDRAADQVDPAEAVAVPGSGRVARFGVVVRQVADVHITVRCGPEEVLHSGVGGQLGDGHRHDRHTETRDSCARTSLSALLIVWMLQRFFIPVHGRIRASHYDQPGTGRPDANRVTVARGGREGWSGTSLSSAVRLVGWLVLSRFEGAFGSGSSRHWT